MALINALTMLVADWATATLHCTSKAGTQKWFVHTHSAYRSRVHVRTTSQWYHGTHHGRHSPDLKPSTISGYAGQRVRADERKARERHSGTPLHCHELSFVSFESNII